MSAGPHHLTLAPKGYILLRLCELPRSYDVAMTDSGKGRRLFRVHDAERVHALEGRPLATFWQRALGYVIDVAFAVLIWLPLEFSWRRFVLHEENIELKWDFHEVGNIVIMLLYWATFNYFGNGRTLGKRVAGTQVASLTGSRMGLWQSVERALGYGAAILEGGLGFVQFFWDKNRMCAQDRLAETVVLDVRTRAQAEHASSP